MLPLTFADWELVQKLIERREIQLRDIIESDGARGVLTGKKVLKEYKQICEILAKLSDPKGRSRFNPPEAKSKVQPLKDQRRIKLQGTAFAGLRGDAP